MTQVEMAAEEMEVLKDVVDFYLSELRMEICDTDSMDFREKLKGKKEVLQRLRGKLEGNA